MASEAIHIIVLSEARERLQMAAMLASVAAVSGHQVTVFLSMNALAHFAREGAGPTPTEGPMGTLLVEKNAPDFLALFQQSVELGDARIHPCSMAMDILGFSKDELAEFISEPMGLTRFLNDAAGGQCWAF